MDDKRYIFSTLEATKAGLTKKEISVLIQHGQIERITRGIYRRIDTNEPNIKQQEQFEAATTIVGKPSAICLHSALHYYGLNPELQPEKQWIMVPFTKRCAHKQIRVFRSRNPYWEIGINNHDFFNITSIERTLIDSLTHPQSIEQELGITALSLALDKKLTDLHKLIAMAGKLKVINRVSGLIKIIVHLK